MWALIDTIQVTSQLKWMLLKRCERVDHTNGRVKGTGDWWWGCNGCVVVVEAEEGRCAWQYKLLATRKETTKIQERVCFDGKRQLNSLNWERQNYGGKNWEEVEEGSQDEGGQVKGESPERPQLNVAAQCTEPRRGAADCGRLLHRKQKSGTARRFSSCCCHGKVREIHDEAHRNRELAMEQVAAATEFAKLLLRWL